MTKKNGRLRSSILPSGFGDLATYGRVALEKEKGRNSPTLGTESVRAKAAVSAVGGLVEPKPQLEILGIETYEGEIVHAARWKPDFILQGKEATVIGTGCNARQVMP
ncbi:uncharacterized protein Z518_02765 [Rhinocladiella mackenziei CBS 650.93]|uniref:Uncharacterized protein n=1 Tax=Rhinocladiella mackenziei CBS 650.93 TaxID=1442369 RepID=A0A0D2IQC4_9EURO|nr:uncharacterized protein Z518_02765 [Rhinocladiella mackenziei CBS 650.93]KIX08109.1 hypothetical protein Z518_02765 [Rhinocladiella mackenziei CBS 650.93]